MRITASPDLNKMFFVYHATSYKLFLKILEAGALLKESQTSSEHSRAKGKFASNPVVSLVDETFSDTYDEVDGVFLKILCNEDVDRYTHDVILVFDPKVVAEKRCIINTVENFGFAIAENGVEGLSHFGGEPGASFYQKQTFPELRNYSFDPIKAEVVFLESLELSNLSKVVVKRKFKSSFPVLQYPVVFR